MNELELLKRIAFFKNISMAELIRRSAKQFCMDLSEQENDIMIAINDLRGKISELGVTEEEIKEEALNEQRNYRIGK